MAKLTRSRLCIPCFVVGHLYRVFTHQQERFKTDDPSPRRTVRPHLSIQQPLYSIDISPLWIELKHENSIADRAATPIQTKTVIDTQCAASKRPFRLSCFFLHFLLLVLHESRRVSHSQHACMHAQAKPRAGAFDMITSPSFSSEPLRNYRDKEEEGEEALVILLGSVAFAQIKLGITSLNLIRIAVQRWHVVVVVVVVG